MARTPKTNREAILREALRIVKDEGLGALSLRTLARNLGVATNALYHYFPDRVALEAEVARVGWKRLLISLQKARHQRSGADAIRNQVKTFILFTQKNEALYRLMLVSRQDTPEELDLRGQYRQFNIMSYGELVPSGDIDRARRLVWSLVHGMISLHRAGMTPEIKDLSVEASDAVVLLLRGISAGTPESFVQKK